MLEESCFYKQSESYKPFAMMLLVFFCVCVACVFLIQDFWKRRKLYALSWSMPGPFYIPFFGNSLYFLCKDEDIFEKAKNLIDHYPSPFRFWFGTKLVVIISKPYQAEKIFSSLKFAQKDKVYKFIKYFVGEGLITSSGPKWKRDRRLLAPLFTNKNIDPFFPLCLREANALIEKLKAEVDGTTFNVETYLKKCFIGIVTESVTGLSYKAQDGELNFLLQHLKRAYIIVHVRIIKVWLHLEYLFKLSKYWKEQEDALQTFQNFFKNAIQNSKQQKSENQHNILRQVLEIQDETPDFGDEKEIVHHMTTLYTASEDTMTVIVSFALVLLGMYPKIQEKIVEELREILGQKPKDVTLEEISNLKYMDMCLKEILRLFPIAPYLMRETSENVQIEDWLIPKGCSIVISIQNLHRDPQMWEKPNEFYPEHFLPEKVAQRHPYAFVPFSAGPRGCIGKVFAYMGMKTVLSTILQHYVIEAEGKLDDIKLKTDITVRIYNEIYPIKIKKRT